MKLSRTYLPALSLALALSAHPPASAQTPARQASAQTPAGPGSALPTAAPAAAQTTAHPAYFIDGYHGGIYGHIPDWQTRFMVDKLAQYPLWKINLELEPVSWDSIAVEHPADYEAFKNLLADQSADGRVEYIDPQYGQSYLYTVTGESIIRQFYYGMRKLRQHFPNMVFSTYSSEEPCFTSALPQILRSYGFKYASLKNPNTCWGGYTRAYGGELVNWIGPDGTGILTVPRYKIEALKPHSTWETIASINTIDYVKNAFKAGIESPVGMCLQDAGWAFGPWIDHGDASKSGKMSYHPTINETWRGYIEHHTPGKTSDNWHFSQEDVLTSLTWGGQVLQEVARKTRSAENRIIAAEKLASMAAVYANVPWPEASFDEAWRTLMLSQHHDCWIVPYNILRNTRSSWASWVTVWTKNTIDRSDSAIDRSMAALTRPGDELAVTVFNTTAVARDENVELELPAGWSNAIVTGWDKKPVPGQVIAAGKLLIRARVPQLGYAVYHLRQAQPAAEPSGIRVSESNNKLAIESDLYSVELDGAKGGAITRLSTKGTNAKDFIDKNNPRSFNELRGNFYNDGGFNSSTETPAKLTVVENGPLRVKVRVDGQIAGTPFSQLLTFQQGEPRIDVHLEIDWTRNHRIGESPDSIKGHELKKEFYNDSFKLQVVFPVALSGQKIYKNAPFDVTQSRLDNTFFDSWDSIKNVVVLNWVDVTDAADKNGLAIFSDETTSYAHGPNYPLGLTVAYSGPGLFWRDYTLERPTVMDYAILPHAGRWDKAGIWTAATRWNEPLLVKAQPSQAASAAKDWSSLLHLADPGWEVSSITVSGHDLLVRLFNAEGKGSIQHISAYLPIGVVDQVALDGHVEKQLDVLRTNLGKNAVIISAPRFGIRTIQFKDVIK